MKQLRKILFLLILNSFYAVRGNAQVQISISPADPAKAMVSDLFNGNVNNTSEQEVRVYMVGIVMNTSTGEEIVKAKTIPIDCKTGYLKLSENLLRPDFSYLNSTYKPHQQLPNGKYIFCLKAFSEDMNEEIGKGCFDLDIKPVAPPRLFSPENSAVIRTLEPNLIWIPPSKASSGNLKVHYEVKLVEVAHNQSVADALINNNSAMKESGINGTSYQLSTNQFKLEDRKTYAWRITALDEQSNVIGSSEIRSFKVAMENDNTGKKVQVNKGFIKLKATPDNKFECVKDELKLIYEGIDEEEATLKISIKDMVNREIYNRVVYVDKGKNKISIELNSIAELKSGSFYNIEALNAENKKFYLQIKYLK